MRNQPHYVELPGDPVFPGPFQQDDTDLRGFLVPVDRDRIARWCETAFTELSGGAVRVRPTSDNAMLTFARIGRIVSHAESHRSRGYMPETDVVFWVPVEVTLPEERFAAWAMPFIFVDRAPAVATGRELYGFPKLQGRFQIPHDPEGGTYRAWADVLRRFDPSTEAGEGLVLEMVREEGPGPGMAEATRQLAQLVTGEEGIIEALFGTSPLRGLMRREIPVIFLRQLRDIQDPSRAAYQEILLTAARHERAHGGGLLSGSWRLRVEALDSPSVARTLGVPPEGVLARAAFHTRFDFTMELGQTLWRADGTAVRARAPRHAHLPHVPSKRKVAVLGGGIGALTAALELTSRPGWSDDLEITVYEMDHRIGGKGASGRNLDVAQRIEEHGLHIWFGFYENAFRGMRKVYAELNRPPGAPLATWQDAFKPHSNVVVMEQVGDSLEPWAIPFPTNHELPGDVHGDVSLSDLLRKLGSYTAQLIDAAIAELQPRGASRADLAAQATFMGTATVLRLMHRLALEAAQDPNVADSRLYAIIHQARKRLWRRLERQVEADAVARRIWITLDFALTALTGAHRDRVVERGIECIDHLDFIEWLAHHGASEMTQRSALVRAGYDLAFAFEGGDTNRPNFAAGVGLYGYMRMLLTYRGAVMYKMQAGMGDVVFTPIYEVLRRRGVHFKFFHRADGLHLSPDLRAVQSISMTRTATVRSGGEYQPLVDVRGLACWPDRALMDQLHLENTPIHLARGRDFDDVILGVPIAALKTVTRELIAASPRWARMVERCKTVCTHAVQVWTAPDRAALGWKNPLNSPEDPILGAFLEPTDTWADMTHLLPREDWPAAATPGHVAYFCGPWREPTEPAADEHSERRHVKARAESLLDRELNSLWPLATDGQGRFRRELLVDLAGRAPGERLEHQWIRANVRPTDRYALSLKGTLVDRLPAGGSGFEGLYLAGDWVDCGFNAGCIEACVMSGLQAARALSGHDVEIYGENPRLRPVR